MKNMIDRDTYILMLKEVLSKRAEKNPGICKMKQAIVESQVAEEMSNYVLARYGAFYKDSLPQLIKESHALLKECLNDLGITK